MLVGIPGTCRGGSRQVQHSPQFWVLLVEVPALSRRPVPDFQHFDYDVVALPAPLPQLEEQGHRHCERGAESPAPPGPRVGLWSPWDQGSTMRGSPLSWAGAPSLHLAMGLLNSCAQQGQDTVVCIGTTPTWGQEGPTSPDWFSFSFWLRLSCLKSIPASLFRVPFPTVEQG